MGNSVTEQQLQIKMTHTCEGKCDCATQIGSQILEAIENKCDEGTYLNVANLLKKLVNGNQSISNHATHMEKYLDTEIVESALLRAEAVGDVGNNRFAIVLNGLLPEQPGVYTRFLNNTKDMIKEYKQLTDMLYDKKPSRGLLKDITEQCVKCPKDRMIVLYARNYGGRVKTMFMELPKTRFRRQ